MDMKRLYLIDATAFCYRAFYAIRGLATANGQPTGAIYGFLNILNKLLKERKPEYLAICFDVSRDTFRSKKFKEYKIQRPPMPDALKSQIPLIKEIVANLGIEILEKPGFEADDIIAALAKSACAINVPVTIVSSDKDILQLVDKDIEVLSPNKDSGVLYNEKEVFSRFNVNPKQIPDVIALMGDSADNIPSVPGIGEKTAVELMKEFHSLDNLLNNIEKISKEKTKAAIKANIQQIKLSKELAVLNQDLDLDFKIEKLKIKDPNLSELAHIFRRLEFKKLLKDLKIEGESPLEIKVEAWDKTDLGASIDNAEDLYLYSAERLVFLSNGKYLSLDKKDPNLKEILLDPDKRKISHDLKKLKINLAKEGLILNGLFFDTMIAAYLINPAQSSYELDNLSFVYLNKILSDAALDSANALKIINQLKPKLEEELKKKGLFKLFTELEMPLVGVLADMELSGITLDLKVLSSLSKEVEKELAALIKNIYSLSGEEFNINSPKQLSTILFERLKLPVVKKNKTGPSTDEEVLNKLAAKHELPSLLLVYRQLMKLKNTYIDTLPELVDKETGKIHATFNQVGTETGRLSSNNPNLQNIPIKTEIGRNIRKAVIASGKDDLLISCDYSQIELRILAHLSGDETLALAFKNNQDIHKATASLIYNCKIDEVSDEMRERAKRVNFGIVYGLTSYGLSKDLNIPVDEAQIFIDAYFSRYPKVKDYIDQQINFAKENGFVKTILGRKRYIPEINSKNMGIRQFAERQAVNTPIQGSAADLIKLAMIHIHDEIKKKELKARLVLQIHDELVFDLEKKELQVLVSLVRSKMENVLKLNVPIKVDIKMGQNWLEMEEVI